MLLRTVKRGIHFSVHDYLDPVGLLGTSQVPFRLQTCVYPLKVWESVISSAKFAVGELQLSLAIFCFISFKTLCSYSFGNVDILSLFFSEIFKFSNGIHGKCKLHVTFIGVNTTNFWRFRFGTKRSTRSQRNRYKIRCEYFVLTI